jgi:hypothetical protein
MLQVEQYKFSLLKKQANSKVSAILILAACHDALRRDTASDALRRGFGNVERPNLAPTQSIGARLVYQNENGCQSLRAVAKSLTKLESRL